MREVRKSAIDIRNPVAGTIRKQEDMAKKYLTQILNEFNKNQTEMETLYLTDDAGGMQSNLGYIASFENFKKLILDALNNRDKSITQEDYTAYAGPASLQVVRSSDDAKLFTPFKRGDVGL